MEPRQKLQQLKLKGYKSFDNKGQTIEFDDITVLLGANGSGKSNLVSFFKMLSYMITGSLQEYIAKHGTANQLLFYGKKTTESLYFSLLFSNGEKENTYEVKLSSGFEEKLFIGGEQITFHRKNHPNPMTFPISNAVNESEISKKGPFEDNPEGFTKKIIQSLMFGIRTYQFHDTSDSAKIKDSGHLSDTRYLRSEGGNLAAFLKMLQERNEYQPYYARIIRTIQRIMPQFKDFYLEPTSSNRDYVRLNWIDNSGEEYVFGPHQISDGSLRFMALATLLLQPPDMIPKFIVLDEPELGLHPEAISNLAGMIRSASKHAQILIATQSTRLVDEFSLENLIVLEREKVTNASVCKRFEEKELREWLDEYSLSELWEKNVIGGQP